MRCKVEKNAAPIPRNSLTLRGICRTGRQRCWRPCGLEADAAFLIGVAIALLFAFANPFTLA